VIRSKPLLEELKNFILQEGDYVYVGRGSADRTMALALAILNARDFPNTIAEAEAIEKRKNKENEKEKEETEDLIRIFNRSIYEKWTKALLT
jgi:hypothetical protein